MKTQSTVNRVATYYTRLQQFWVVQSIVHRPSYNADQNPALWKEHEVILEWLKKEADELFCLGVSVYH